MYIHELYIYMILLWAQIASCTLELCPIISSPSQWNCEAQTLVVPNLVTLGPGRWDCFSTNVCFGWFILLQLPFGNQTWQWNKQCLQMFFTSEPPFWSEISHCMTLSPCFFFHREAFSFAATAISEALVSRLRMWLGQDPGCSWKTRENQ